MTTPEGNSGWREAMQQTQALLVQNITAMQQNISTQQQNISTQEQTMAVLVQTQAAQQRDMGRLHREMAKIITILNEHSRILADLPEAIRERIGLKGSQ